MPALPIQLFPRDRRICSEPGWRRRLDRRDDSPNARVESPFVSRKAVSSSPFHGDRGKRKTVRTLCLRAKGLLLRRFSDLAVVSCRFPNHQEAGCHRRIGVTFWIQLGGFTTGEAAGVKRVDAVSSPRTDEKAGSGFALALEA